MSDHTEQTDNGKISRREAIKTTAKVAGVAAFATPAIVNMWSSTAMAAGGDTSACDGSGVDTNNPCNVNDSDAVPVSLAGEDTNWNLNCQDVVVDGEWGRYNAQQTLYQYVDPVNGITVNLRFGQLGTDNFPVQYSFYTLEPVSDDGTSYDCTAIWSLQNNASGGGGAACDNTPVDETACSDPYNAPPPWNVLDTNGQIFTPDADGGNGALLDGLALPYCQGYKNKPGTSKTSTDINDYDKNCDPNLFLYLDGIVCCPSA